MARTWIHPDQVNPSHRPWIIGHRGFPLRAPENSLPSFEAAIQAGVDGVELDFHASSDGILFCAHDDTPERCIAHCPGEYLHTHWDQLAWETVQKWPLFPLEKFSQIRPCMPTLAEAVEAIHEHALPVLERKSGSAEMVVEVLQSLSLDAPVVVQSFDWAFLIRLQEIKGDCPIIPVALGQGNPRGDRILALPSHHISILNWRYQDINPIIGGAFRKRGFHLWAWSLNRECQFRTVHHVPLSALTTDDPVTIGEYFSPTLATGETAADGQFLPEPLAE